MLRGTIVAGACLLLLGCNDASGPQQSATQEPTGKQYLLSERPADAIGVLEARDSAEDAKEIAVVGRIGGEREPFVDGLAAFTLVDESLVPCNEIPGDSCPTPWDYCCAPKLSEAKLLVKVVGPEGAIPEEDARRLLGAKELSTVVAKGKAQRDEAGNVTILASKLFVVPGTGFSGGDHGGHDHGGHDHDGHDHGDHDHGDHDHGDHDHGDHDHGDESPKKAEQ